MTTGPAAPTLRADAAERARTVAGRSPAALCVRGLGVGRPLAHATTTTGTTYVLVPTGGEVDAALAGRDDLTAVLLRDPLRAQLWLSGWLTPVHPAARRAAVLAFAGTRPVAPLLDVGRGITLLRLDLAEVVLREGERCTEVGPQGYAAARPDPLAAVEARVLQHLDREHPQVLDLLRSRIPAGDLGPRDVVRPLGLDRFGFRLRIERPAGRCDLRVPFPRPLTCPGQLQAATRQLICSARASRG
ncbi:DUF2470 domain-containing protein [Geodermatophilus obscurus]|uniref:DUF2470 domain-containing protein n=1 Tax=Geodermatophilus obscurus (strain ATCC 25078 / DSM 43160 / JCM 3152 / CCUG 61914 / KCC A-0152 / KCTC 9177 / NBRC 13315 / NRRL B-3577 / G-20) TaxID=526225 RepID=D2S6B8_GEOOG|nr:DUF2470 domain-containing protein [Geodermatophilus obscurus]ADB75292.1 conserved hypothetical protein [Geodermatophilus obscurus DSM 43160]